MCSLRSLPWLLLLAVLSGCVDDKKSSQEEAQGVIPQYQLDALQKAQSVDNMMQQRSQELDQQLQQSE